MTALITLDQVGIVLVVALVAFAFLMFALSLHGAGPRSRP